MRLSIIVPVYNEAATLARPSAVPGTQDVLHPAQGTVWQGRAVMLS